MLTLILPLYKYWFIHTFHLHCKYLKIAKAPHAPLTVIEALHWWAVGVSQHSRDGSVPDAHCDLRIPQGTVKEIHLADTGCAPHCHSKHSSTKAGSWMQWLRDAQGKGHPLHSSMVSKKTHHIRMTKSCSGKGLEGGKGRKKGKHLIHN